MTTLVPVFADQLTINLPSLTNAVKDDTVVVMMEVTEEADLVWHHRKKLVFLFSAMRHFAETLKNRGWRVDYVTLDDPENSGSFDREIKRLIGKHGADEILITEPGEYRVLEKVKSWREATGLEVEILDDTRFIASHGEFEEWAEGRKQLRMEYFYREMRKKTGYLMDGEKPAGDKWNFDGENRKPPKDDLFMPEPLRFEPDETTRSVIKMVGDRFTDRFGDVEPFWFAVTREDALKALGHFIEEALERFGDYQDAMMTDQPYLYHSLLSFYINAGLLDPREVCEAVCEAYEAGKAPINCAEGFIRQIIGWREYIRGIYWLNMPGYEDSNDLDASRDLPTFYWSGETDLNCLHQVISQTRREAYAHHIQRLMVTGTFALLAGIKPKQVHEWYLAVYADAFEWVEMPNTIGMSQYADGGLLASKPYAASGAYINRMSDYCRDCRYDVKQKTGDNACPFNALYWNFLDRNRTHLSNNPRMGMMYRNLDRMNADERDKINERAVNFLESL